MLADKSRYKRVDLFVLVFFLYFFIFCWQLIFAGETKYTSDSGVFLASLTVQRAEGYYSLSEWYELYLKFSTVTPGTALGINLMTLGGVVPVENLIYINKLFVFLASYIWFLVFSKVRSLQFSLFVGLCIILSPSIAHHAQYVIKDVFLLFVVTLIAWVILSKKYLALFPPVTALLILLLFVATLSRPYFPLAVVSYFLFFVYYLNWSSVPFYRILKTRPVIVLLFILVPLVFVFLLFLLSGSVNYSLLVRGSVLSTLAQVFSPNFFRPSNWIYFSGMTFYSAAQATILFLACVIAFKRTFKQVFVLLVSVGVYATAACLVMVGHAVVKGTGHTLFATDASRTSIVVAPLVIFVFVDLLAMFLGRFKLGSVKG